MTTFLRNIKSLYCSAGNCRADELKQQQDDQNNRYTEIIADNLNQTADLNNTNSFYTSGIYGTNNCNTFVTTPAKSQTDIALESVDSVLTSGSEPTVPQSQLTTSPYCSIETFDNISSKYNKKYIILLVLIIICLIIWIYYTILTHIKH